MSKKLHIFKSGTRTAMSGATVTITPSDLAASASAYDPAKHEAPLVVGHPQHNAPAYGWVQSVEHADGELYVTPQQVDASFAEAVDAGRYKKISASFFLPDSPSNPVPGVYYLRHVGFLGALPPAVKGLRPVEFGDDGDAVTIEFGDWGDMENAGLWRRLREWMIGKFGVEEADKVAPNWTVDTLTAEANKEDVPPTAIKNPSFSEPPVTEAEKAALEAENQQLKAQLAQAKQAETDAKVAARSKEHSDFAEGLVAEGRLLPKHKPAVLAFLNFSDADDSLEFGEGDAKQPLGAAFRNYLKEQPVQVAFGEHATKDKAAGSAGTVEFAAPAGYAINQERAALHNKALAYQKANNVSYEQAVKALEHA